MSGNLKASVDLRVPDELWLEIFIYLAREDLFPLHSVSRTIHRIARPLLFATFAFHPYAMARRPSSTYRYLLPNETQINRALRRLRFWASDEIAPFVKRSIVSPWRRCDNVEYTPCRDGSMILHNFFQLLPRFKNIHALSFLRVEFEETHLAVLASLKPLRELAVDGCWIPLVKAPLNFKVSRFKLRIDNYLASEDCHQWLRMLDRQTLSQLMLGDDVGASAGALITIPFTFPNIHTLSISARRLEELAYLSEFPAVQSLTLESIHPPIHLPTLQPIILPDLESYEGLPEFLHLLGPTTCPTKLKILARIHPRFLNASKVMPHAHLIISLALQMDYLLRGVFRSLLGSFTSLAELHLLFGHPDTEYRPNISQMYTDKTLFMDLSMPPTPFPTTLSTLSISWRIDSGTPVEDAIAAARAAGSALAPAHSNLRKIEFSSYAMRYEWERDLEGQLATESVVCGRKY
ncbi:hypothetical protein FB45DRAFT_1009467 [Roridomyces roridus]|uniref:F-box domain-containing protein n=1 Tax=Roridomyces roridus TaxID=1738132 RepID=A0AAD7B7B1_9AGAR|nr:hypothetical protein FB45DRAFT_1009467 [Roridomyces roridus]